MGWKAEMEPRNVEAPLKATWRWARREAGGGKRQRPRERTSSGGWLCLITHIKTLAWLALISKQNMYLWCWGETGCHRCETRRTQIQAARTASAAALAYWHLGRCLIWGWLLKSKSFQPPCFSPAMALHYEAGFCSAQCRLPPLSGQRGCTMRRGAAVQEQPCLPRTPGRRAADKGQEGNRRKARWQTWPRQWGAIRLQAGSWWVHSPDNEASRACSPHQLAARLQVLLAPLSHPCIPLPKRGFWGCWNTSPSPSSFFHKGPRTSRL